MPRPPLRERPAVRLALATLLLFAALAAVGARWHWVEEAGSAERDGYVEQAEEILRGDLPRDPYRPAFYPLATAALARCGLPPFTAARLLSEAAAAVLAALAFLFGRRLAGETVGWLAFAATAANPNLWILGQHVTTDMPFAALAAATLAAGFAYLERPGWRPALAAGAALGLAAFTRANAAFLLPPLAVAWWLAPAVTPARGRRLRHLAGGFATALALFTPHLVLRATVFGDPLHDENWKNLAFKLHGFPDWSYLDRVPYDGLLDVMTSDPGAVVAGFLAELWRFFAGGGLAQLVGTPLHALLLAAGAALALAAPVTRRRAAWLLFAAATFLAAVAATFFAWGRLLLCLLPIANAVAFAPWGRDVRSAFTWWPRRRWAAPALAAVAAAAIAMLAAKTAFFRLPDFVARHPYAEVEVLRGLAAETPPGTLLAGTSPFLGRYLDRPYLYVEDAFGREVGEPERWYAATHERLSRSGADYLVAGAVDLRDRPPSLLSPEAPVEWLESVGGDDRVRVWKVVPGARKSH